MKRKTIDIEEVNDTTEKTELLEVLTKLKPGLSVKDDEQMDHYLFMEGRVATYNGDVCIVVEFPIGLSGMVKADEFYKLISNTPAKTIQLELRNNQVVVECGKDFSFGMTCTEPGIIYEKVKFLDDSELQWRTFTEEAKRAIVLCSFTTSKDITRPDLAGVHVGGGEVLSSDNYRISWYQLEEGMRRNFLVPATSVVHLIDYDLESYALTNSWVHFKGKGIVYNARLLAEEFPQNTKKFFPTNEEKGFVLPKELVKLLNKTLILQQDVPLLDKRVSLAFGKNKLVCEVMRQNLGWIKESISLKDGPKESVKVEVNPIFLKEILKYSTKVTINDNRMLFLSDDFKFKHLIVLS